MARSEAIKAVPDPAATPAAEVETTITSTHEMREAIVDLLAVTHLIPKKKVGLIRDLSQNGPIAQVLVDQGLASTEAIAKIVAARHQLPRVELGSAGVDSEASATVPLHVLERIVAIPFAFDDNGMLCVAIADPQNVHGIDELRLASKHQIALHVAAQDDIATELERLARTSEAFGARSSAGDPYELEVVDEDADDLEADDGISDAPLVRLVNSIIFEAAEDGASDIHFEPQSDTLIVRLRIDGVLHELQRIPKRMAIGVTTRLKVLAKLDIAERRKPQDGRISLSAAAAGRLLDVRVATLPTVEGESVTMRLLDKSKRPPTLEELGLADDMRERLSDLISRPTGALLVTGPTGSGKSTTLFGALNQINRVEINIITVEDPVEYRLPGVTQVQINIRAGMTFATALRSIVRSDPDVIMVGEIRDVETAKISIESALTGHFVLSTLHTNDAPSALTRLNEMGVEPFLTGAAVTGVLAQRLARKLCEHCREEYVPSEEQLVRARISPEDADAFDGKSFFRKVGCVRCRQTGYRGRVGVFQLLTMSETMQRLAAEKASHEELQRAAIAEGMGTLWEDGLLKIAQGLTSIEELARVTV
ncbi:MAG TPA: GspE/PulE family protein [Gaiellaceae bacterium]|nr:GspE/PulE family protein [Gaiellaceae bacterium]